MILESLWLIPILGFAFMIYLIIVEVWLDD